jgi:predicted nucleic-acid-binding protein
MPQSAKALNSSVIAVDTNILVRFLTKDDKEQAELAYKMLRDHEVWVTKTVLLETEWVLRYSYEFSPHQIEAGLRALLGLSNLRVEEPAQVLGALPWYSGGMDFADALHLAGAQLRPLFTFDQKFRKKAALLAPQAPVEHP